MIRILRAAASFFIVTVFLLLFSSSSYAQMSTDRTIFEQNCTANNQTEFCKQARSQRGENRIIGPSGILTRVAQLIVYLTGAISVVMIVIGGFRYVLSGGDSNATKGAKDTIMYAVIGLVVAIFSQIIVTFVLSRL